MSKRLTKTSGSAPSAAPTSGGTSAPDLTHGLGNAGMLERIQSRAQTPSTVVTEGVVSEVAPSGRHDELAGDPGARAEPAAVVEALYEAFARRDGAAMGALYHPDANFSDPVFGSLRGAQIGAMWTLLCESAPDLVVRHSGVRPDGSGAHWDAAYTFPATGMAVRNSVDARFEIRDGLIVTHTDDFDFYRWSRQALGIVGWLFGWAPAFRSRMTAASRAQLDRWQEERRGDGGS